MTTLTDLIKSAERKIADPTTTPQTVEREKAFVHYLTSMQAEIEIKDEALAELRAEVTELYAHICESGDMARERSRKRSDNVTISGNWDELLRHKWPDEKPEKGQYLVARRYKYGDGKLQFTLASYWFDQRYDGEVYSPESEEADKWGYIKNPKKIEMCWMESSDDGCRDMSDEVVYWWNLPEVTE